MRGKEQAVKDLLLFYAFISTNHRPEASYRQVSLPLIFTRYLRATSPVVGALPFPVAGDSSKARN